VDAPWAHFSGRGYGHGVGMCQVGAYGLAKQGFSAEQILNGLYNSYVLLAVPLFVVVVAVVAAVSATPHGQQPASPPDIASRYVIPPALNDGWMTGSLEQVGIDRGRIEAMTDSIRDHPELNVHAVLIERDGRLVYEEYFAGKDERWGVPIGVVTFTRATKHDVRSVTKSVVSALVGIALNSGSIPSLDRPLLDYFPEFKELQVPERRLITIRHALMMAAGFEWNEDVPYTDPKNDEIVMIRSPDPLRYVLSRPIVAPPKLAQ
jgi:CubicO group peptidase (beta-lactamase class C family)